MEMLTYNLSVIPTLGEMILLFWIAYNRKKVLGLVNIVRKDSRPVISSDLEMMGRLRRKWFYANIQNMSLMLYVIFIHLYGYYPTSAGEERNMYYRFTANRLFGNWPTIINISYVFFYFAQTIIAVSTYSIAAGIVYVALTIDFQYLLLVDDLNHKVLIHQGLFSLMNNTSYQAIIYRNLKQSVKGYLRVNKFMKITVESSQNDFMFLWVVYSIGLLLFSFITIFGSLEYYNKLCECPWNYWNIANRKMLLLMLTNTKEQCISCFGLIESNYSYLLTSFRVWYSIICFCSNCPNQSLKEKIAIDGPNGL
ncbi:unnamed protein product [Acanthoscelides obtectus]|uniref:Uncharacterized protein n=1 Tax=Acanthoscelides obtectus TaxID=200917 RepID=A0A9P0LDC0_ACAOB|nr:unnamed protein product [Acanthoscelides obtectus]CAK1660237.1 hypothetical protein AOBTE_LOCUS21931 [Acanthoscelides obtectus]